MRRIEKVFECTINSDLKCTMHRCFNGSCHQFTLVKNSLHESKISSENTCNFYINIVEKLGLGFINTSTSLHANPLAWSPGQVKLDSDKRKSWKNLFEYKI